MRNLIMLREDFVRSVAKVTKNAAHGHRILALAEIYDEGTRTDAARIGRVGLQNVLNWVVALRGRPGGADRWQSARHRSKLNEAQRQALARIIESGPIPAIHGVLRWRLRDLA